METLYGIAVFPGVAVGRTLVLDRGGLRIPRYLVDPSETSAELKRLDECLAAVAEGIAESARDTSAKLGAEIAAIFDAHRRIVNDPHLRESAAALILKKYYSAEHAVHSVMTGYAEFFRKVKSSHFADRAADILDIERQLLDKLTGSRRELLRNLDHEVVLLANDLTPSETASLNPKFVKGICTSTGGRTSHTAIVAGSLEIPAVVGIGEMPEISDGEMVILDAHRGLLILNPDDEAIERYQTMAVTFHQFEESLSSLRDLPAVTEDGVRIFLDCNIEFLDEASHVIERGADGIGLYRTEFLYLERDSLPSEEEHFAAYSTVMKAVGPNRPVVFRTMDLGGDKYHPGGKATEEPNPFLGLRSVRLSLRNLVDLKTQLRAMLRASVLGDVRIMFPMISTLREMRRCRMILADVMEDLQEEEVPFNPSVPVGMMVEVPSAAILANQFAACVDFFSIGTNDLIQYTLAADRTNERVASLYSASDPAVIRLLRQIVRAADRQGINVSVCGQMSGDPIYTLLLIGLGLRRLSVSPHMIPEIKKVVRSVTIPEAASVARRILKLDSAGDITKLLRNRTRRLIPEFIDDIG